MFVEELIARLACDGKYIFEPEIVKGNGWETNFINSLSTQIHNGNALTEKQALLVQGIIKRYQVNLEVYFQRQIDVNNPVYKTPFRRLIEEKSIKIETVGDKKQIVVRFGYDAEIIKKIQEYVSSTSWKSIMYNTPIKHEAGAWNPDIKAWVFGLKEENIVWLASNLVELGFHADEQFADYLEEINKVFDNMYEHAPYITKENGHYAIKNFQAKVENKETNNVIEYLFWAKTLGITAWDDAVDADYKSDYVPQVTKSILNTTKALFVDSYQHTPETLCHLIKYGGPALIIIPGGSEIKHTTQWHQLAKDWGIESSDMSVMFRMPNENGGAFNQYIKDHQLNNDIHAGTKIVFVSTKIPKPLVKSGLRFNTVLNLGYYRDLHFSMSVLLQSTTNIVYYNNKQPYGVNALGDN